MFEKQKEFALKEIERLTQENAETQRVIKENRIAQLRQKTDVVQKLMEDANEAQGSGVAQPAAAWIVGGDMNLSHSQLVSLCSWFVQPSKPCFSNSGVPPTRDAHKSDIAISQGIALVHVPAWVGVHFRPCVSDAHDMVLVAGSLGGKAAA